MDSREGSKTFVVYDGLKVRFGHHHWSFKARPDGKLEATVDSMRTGHEQRRLREKRRPDSREAPRGRDKNA
jgi:hypothetical protein